MIDYNFSIDILDTLTYADSDGKAIDSFTSKNGPYERIPGYTTKETKAIYQEVLGVLCDIGHLGDMFQVCFYFSVDYQSIILFFTGHVHQ